MSLTHLIEEIKEIVDKIRLSDPAISRVLISDNQGVEIVQYVKSFRFSEAEKKSKNPIIPLLNSIMLNSEKFLNFMRKSQLEPFILTWMFEEYIILASSSSFGFIGVFCEKDVDSAIVKEVLKEESKKYNEIVKNIFA
jgi:hypothetical protein